MGSWHFSACVECEHPRWQLVEAAGDAGGLCEGQELSPGVDFLEAEWGYTVWQQGCRIFKHKGQKHLTVLNPNLFLVSAERKMS